MIKVDNTVMPIDHDETQDPRTLGGTEDGAIGQGTINMTMITLQHRRCLKVVLVGREDTIHPSY